MRITHLNWCFERREITDLNAERLFSHLNKFCITQPSFPMHSISFGAEGDNSVEVSVKILLKQAYSAHLAKVKSLESEVNELRAKLLKVSKSDEHKCNWCQETQKALDSFKQEYAAVLDEQKKKCESSVQKLILLENRNNVSFHGNSSTKQDDTGKSNEIHVEPSQLSQKKQVLTNISTNIGLHEEYLADKKTDYTKILKASGKDSHSVEAEMSVVSHSALSPKTSIAPINPKDFISSLQSSFLDHSKDDSDTVLVTETLDMLDEVPGKNNNQNRITKKETNAPKGKFVQTLLDANEGKENIFVGAEYSVEKTSGKRCNASNLNENEQTLKKYKCGSSKEQSLENTKLCGEKVLLQANPLRASSKDINICYGNANPQDSTNNAENFDVNSAFFDVDPSFLEQKSEFVSNNNKNSKTQSPTKKSKTRNPAIEILHDDDADFQTSVSSISKRVDESGAWKMAKKNIKKSGNSCAGRTTSRFKMTLEAPGLNFRKPKYKQTKLSKSIFQPSDTPATDSVISLERCDDNVVEDNGSDTNSSVKKDSGSDSVKEDDTNSRAKDDDGHSRITEDNGNNGEIQKELHSDNETVTWGEGTFSHSEMQLLGSFSSSEMVKLKNMTVDMDATFVPHHMLQNFNDSVPVVPGASNAGEDLMERKNDSFNAGGNSSSNFVENVNEQKVVHEVSCANQHAAYRIEQYPEKKSPKSPPSKTRKQKCNSFDRVPSPEMPNYKFKNDPVRNKDKRQQLKGFDCKECEKYYSALGLSDEEKKERLKQCSRHRATYVPPGTPANFWELDFPDTQECKERGYTGDTQKVALKSRRRHPLK